MVFPAPLGPRKATTCPRGIEKVTSRTARNEPNCLQSPSASIITDVDMPVVSSPSLESTSASRRTHPTDLASGPVKREPALRSGTPMCTNAWRAGPVLSFITRNGRMGSLCASRNFNATVGLDSRESVNLPAEPSTEEEERDLCNGPVDCGHDWAV